MKKILVPIDFSDYSMAALKVASYMAKVKEMEIRILHVVEDSYTPYYNMVGINMVEENTLFTYRKELVESIKNQLSEIVQKLRKENIQVEFDVVVDIPKNAIVRYAEENETDIIVMGSHGQNAIEDIFLGGTSEKIIRASAIPVLTVHTIQENYKIDKIVFASDFKEEGVEYALERVIEFAEIFMAELFLVRINTNVRTSSATESRERVDELSKKFNLSSGAVTSYADRNEEEGIVNYAKEIGADLIALCTHGRTGLARLFKRSIAEDVVGSSDIPVLTFNISKDKKAGFPPVKRDRKLTINHGKKINRE